MKLNLKQVNEENSQGSGEFESLEEGWYPLEIENAEYKEASTGAFMVSVKFKVFDGVHKNRRVWNTYGIINKDGAENPVGQGMLAGLLRAADSPLINKDEELEMNRITMEMIGLKVNGYLEPSMTNNNKPSNDLKRVDSLAKAPAGQNPGPKKTALFE